MKHLNGVGNALSVFGGILLSNDFTSLPFHDCKEEYVQIPDTLLA
jgi:hypothetical protein